MILRIGTPIFIGILLSTRVLAGPGDVDYRNRSHLSPNDYMLGSHGKRSDPVWDSYREIDLSVDLGIGSDCGRASFRNTIRASLKNILDTKYLGDMGKDILAASPMLLTCYFSPTWCAILKNARLRANLLANTRLDQCAFINKYTDNRVEDFYQERQQCVNREIQRSGGNLEDAMEKCKNYWDVDLASWAGGNKRTEENRLVESTATWAGFRGKEARETVDLVKQFIGDNIIKKGRVSVDYGPKRVQLTPRTYLRRLQNLTYSQLCDGILEKVESNGGYKANVDKLVTDKDLKELSDGSEDPLVDRETIRALAYMPYKQRRIGCRKLADAVSMTIYTERMNETLDFVTSKMGTNPNLPENQKREVDRKRRALKDQIELTLTLQENKNEPLNKVVSQINTEGDKYQKQAVIRKFNIDYSNRRTEHNEAIFMDCADDILCKKNF